MSTKREVLKCRRCEVAAEIINVDLNMLKVHCPVCGGQC